VSHYSSHVVLERVRYSSLEEECDTLFCFLDFHYTGEVPRKIQNPVIEHLVLGHVAQSESLNAFNYILELATKNNP